MTPSELDFDVDFDFVADTREGKDPDADSPTLRRYNRMLWSKPLKSGEVLALEAPKVRSHGYLVYTAPDGNKMWFSSDAITHSYTHSRRPKGLVTAADIAALAGAQGLGDPCVFAERSARANGMALASCTIEGSDVIVEVTAPPPAVVGRLLAVLGRDARPVSATARAGPPST